MLQGKSLVQRYRQFFNIPQQVTITEQMVLTHWELEQQLTQDLLSAPPEQRWQTFERCYTQLYHELDWLNQGTPPQDQRTTALWQFAIGSPPQRLYEVGSGKGSLIQALAQAGFDCCATEVTQERGEKHLHQSVPNLTWRISDGVHLDQFELPESYDVVMSDQVLEHLHPTDLDTHLNSAYRILKPSGRYILRTPQRFSGPYDVSRVFQCTQPQGMHLREYTYGELIAAVQRSGFTQVSYAFVPNRLQGLVTRWLNVDQFQQGYLRWLVGVERSLNLIPSHRLRRGLATLLTKVYLFSDNVSLIAWKR
jgi:2-polyprenyl-3-methyl-5-hydroxy-6-metoxy-1,4-benzoquinol methylase